jgi:hypothetical protein
MRNNLMRAAALCVFVVMAAVAFAAVQPWYLLKGVTVTGAGSAVEIPPSGQEGQRIPTQEAFLASVAGTGVVSATVNIEVTTDPTIGWAVLATVTLEGTTLASNGTTSNAAWPYVRGNVTAIAGTSAAVTLSMYP